MVLPDPLLKIDGGKQFGRSLIGPTRSLVRGELNLGGIATVSSYGQEAIKEELVAKARSK